MKPSNPLILLVEDNRDDEELTRIALKRSGVKTRLAVVRDGPEAIDYLLRQGSYVKRPADSNPSLILLDLKLPKMDGIEVLKEIKTRPDVKLIPVVMLTTSNEERDIIASYQNGANSYIQKSGDFERFLKNVRALTRYWLTINETIAPY